MRIRIQTLPPFPKVKAWFAPPSQISAPRHQSNCRCQDHPLTILELKDLLCSRVYVLKKAGTERFEVALFRDEYELLDESDVADVLAEGEEVMIKYRLRVEVDEQGQDTCLDFLRQKKIQADTYESPSRRSVLSKKAIGAASSEGGKVSKKGCASTKSRSAPYPPGKPKIEQAKSRQNEDKKGEGEGEGEDGGEGEEDRDEEEGCEDDMEGSEEEGDD